MNSRVEAESAPIKEQSGLKLITADIPSSGIRSIDTQHDLLKGMLNDIISHYNENESSFDPKYAASSISAFVAYCFSHFATEESIQRKANWPGHEQHRQAHIQCRESMLKYQEEINERFSDEFMVEMVTFVRDWFVGHTCNKDTQFYQYRQEVGEN